MARVTVEAVARSVLAALDTQAGHLLAAQWVSDRYRRIASRVRFRHLRQVGELVIPAATTTGLATATQGSRTVTGDATAQAAWAALPPGTYHMRLTDAPWYAVESVGSSLLLTSEYAEASSASAGYTLARRFLALLPDVRWLGEFVHMRLGTPLTQMSLTELNLTDPDRTRVGTAPDVYAEIGMDGQGRRVFEFYPYSTQAELIAYAYWSNPPMMSLDDELPAFLPEHVLKEGALIDAMRYEASKAMRAGQVEAAAYWRNEYRAQATSWERDILDLIRADRGTDDVSFILQLPRGGRRSSADVRTAQDVVLSRWPL